MNLRKQRSITTLSMVLLLLAVSATEGASQTHFRGKVEDVAGAMIPDAQIDMYSGKYEWHTRTKAGGTFDVPDLPPGVYDLEVSRAGFRKQVIEDVRIGTSEAQPMTIVMQVGTSADSCGDSLSRVAYVETSEEPRIRGVVSSVSYREVTDDAGRKRTVSSVNLLGDTVVSVERSGVSGKLKMVRTDARGKFEIRGLEPGLYVMKASRKGYASFAPPPVRVRAGKALEVEFALGEAGSIVLCQ